MANFVIKHHSKLLKDFEKLDKAQFEAVHKKMERIKQNPEEFKHLGGGGNCYTVRVEDRRLVFYFDNLNLWFLILDSRKTVYEEYMKRLYDLKMKLQ